MPLIGFAGAPFTLASYLVEGGPSKLHERTKAMMLADPATWHALMGSALTDLTIAFLRLQLDAGVDAIQVFDSWAGHAVAGRLPQLCAAAQHRVFAALADAGVPMTHFGWAPPNCWAGAMRSPGAGATVVGVDWRTTLADAAARRPGTCAAGQPGPRSC